MNNLRKIVLDLETQKEFAEVGGRGKNHLLKVSVCGVYFYETNRYAIYEERDLAKLAPLLGAADQLIGYNIKDFDLVVLQPYVNFDLSQIPCLDLLSEINKILGHRIPLQSVAEGSLNMSKSGDGKNAIRLYRARRLDELKKYCLKDVEITKLVYDYALKNQKVLFRDYFKIQEIPLPIVEAKPRQNVMQQSVLF